MSEKTRYSDEELQEFKELILAKLDKAKKNMTFSKLMSPTPKATTLPTHLLHSRFLKKVQALLARKRQAVWQNVR